MTSPTPVLTAPASNETRSWRARFFSALVWFYGAILCSVMLVRYGIGDRFPWSFAMNSLLLYAFSPVPLILFVVLLRRDRKGLSVVSLSAFLFVWHWGGPLVPSSRKLNTNETPLRVMTYNTLGYNHDTAGTNSIVRSVDADIVAFQELAPEHAEALEQEFSAIYPHRLMDARPGVAGCGILSRYPLRKIDAGPLHRIPWIGTPMAVEIEFPGYPIRFVNFHTYAGPMYTQMRKTQAQALADFAAMHPGPLIFAGDLNATDQNEAHTIILQTMHDAWREAGWGFGHTFPGKPTPDLGGSRPVILGIPVPMWLVRIDYIFHSDSFVAVDAHVGPDDGGSDHRPVVVTLALRP